MNSLVLILMRLAMGADLCAYMLGAIARSASPAVCDSRLLAFPTRFFLSRRQRYQPTISALAFALRSTRPLRYYSSSISAHTSMNLSTAIGHRSTVRSTFNLPREPAAPCAIPMIFLQLYEYNRFGISYISKKKKKQSPFEPRNGKLL